jgi:predicted amidohydrolase YtcJ
MRSIHAAVTRDPWEKGLPDQRSSLYQAVNRSTAMGAYTEFAESKKGMLRKGMLADVVVLNEDIEAGDVATLDAVCVRMTICDGRIVFET